MGFYDLAQASQDNPGVTVVVDERQTSIQGLNPATSDPPRQAEPLTVGPAQPYRPDFQPHTEKPDTKPPNDGHGGNVMLL